MFLKEILSYRNQCFGIGKAFIRIRRIRFLFDHDVRMCLEEVFIKKADVPDNAETVCEDAELIGITEASMDLHLLDGRVCSSMGGHGTIGGFIRVIGIIQTICLFESF